MDNLRPGEYAAYLTLVDMVDEVGFAARRFDLEIRDCVVVQMPTGTFIAVLVRKPFGASVVEQYVRHGRGVVDIDAARIDVSTSDPNMRPNAHNHARTTGGEDYVNKGGLFDQNYAVDLGRHDSRGRFPSNFLLVHGPDCEKVGTRKVKTGTAYQDNKEVAYNVFEGGWDPKGVSGEFGYASEDGTEEIDDWECQPNCPVHLLDLQTGELHSQDPATRMNGQKSPKQGVTEFQTGSEAIAYGDKGGASRYFYQAPNLDNVYDYLRQLTGQPEDT